MTSQAGWHRKTITAAALRRRRQYASSEHRRLRAAIAARINRGEPVNCWRCGQHIAPGTRWHLGHDDHDRRIYRGAEHARCNLTAAARQGARTRNATQPTQPTRAQTRRW